MYSKIPTFLLLLSIVTYSLSSFADDSSSGDHPTAWNGGPGGFGDGGEQPHHHGGGGGRRPPGGGGGLLGPDGMKACAEAAGVTITKGQKPDISDTQKSQIKSCMSDKESAMKSCLSAAGVTLPDPPQPGQKPDPSNRPKLDDSTKQAIESCRQQVLNGSSSSSTDTGTDTSTNNNTESSSAVRSAL